MRFLLAVMILIISLWAQTYEEYLRAQEQAFSSFKEERDKEFSTFLNKEWKAYKEAQGMKGYEEEKPKSLPKAIKKTVAKPKKKRLIIPQPLRIHRLKVYTKIIIPPTLQRLKTLYLNFFGVDLEVHYDRSVLVSIRGTISKNKIADSWDKLAQSEYETTLKELKEIALKLRLNDWGKYLLIQKVSDRICKNENEAKVFSWFVLLKMDYDAHIAYQKHKIILLLPVEGALYNTVYYTLNHKKYYAIDYYARGKLGSIMTYENVYEGASSAISFRVDTLPRLAQEKVMKRLVFSLDDRKRSVELSYNKNILNFFQTYPQVGYTHYFSSPESILLEDSIKASFEPLILGKSQSEALDIILSFVQHAFQYQVDDAQFDKEKVMFPSETIFYPYSDCEDRAILFSYMVKTLLGMDVIGVKYTNHMATAVKVQEKIEGEYILLGKSAYVIADPSYINANIGISMPQFVGSNAYKIVSTGGEK